jgi:integrase
VKGFGVRKTAAGASAYVLRYRRRSDGRDTTWTIGDCSVWIASAARDEAKRLKRLIDTGHDPVGEHQAGKAAPTVNDLCSRFEKEHLPKKRLTTQRDYKQQITADILPAIGKLKVAAVTYSDIDTLHRAISDRAPYHANRVLAVLSKMFSQAIRWKWRTDNPCKGIERNQEQKRKRYASKDELARLTEALAVHPDQQAANIVRLLLLTGARRGEAFHAKWADFDLTEGTWLKPGGTTKQRTDHVVPLSAPARQLLAGIERTKSPYVFPGRTGAHRKDIKDSWAKICNSAKIMGLRVHDLRHSFASTLAGAGYNLHLIGALLGHTQPSTTHRYAHLLDDPLRQATERAGAILSRNKSAEVVSIKGAGK